ncbi:MAG: hypothetical protein HFI82_03495 [Eubacterium sp.]|jgi:uncharacterized membrane protein|nr:hypothetical protein [Eubacterium sp.]
MNTKSIPAVLALIAGFVTCVMSFVQQVDTVVFAKRFVIVCIIFFAIGTAASIIIQINFKEEVKQEEASDEEESAEEDEDGEEQVKETDETSE